MCPGTNGTFDILEAVYCHVATSSRQTEMPLSVDSPGPRAAIDILYDAIEYRNVTFYLKTMPIDQAYKEAVKQVEKGQGKFGEGRMSCC